MIKINKGASNRWRFMSIRDLNAEMFNQKWSISHRLTIEELIRLRTKEIELEERIKYLKEQVNK